jgi:hypothetical protein
LLKDSEIKADEYSNQLFERIEDLVRKNESDIVLGFLESALHFMREKTYIVTQLEQSIKNKSIFWIN